MQDRFASNGRLSIRRICGYYQISRQAYYQSVRRIQAQAVDQKKVLMHIKQRRKLLPREGGRKLYKTLHGEFTKMGLKTGRDKLFDILREHGLLVYPRRKYAVTTNSNHPFKVYTNLIAETKPTGINQIWVSDITYIPMSKGFCYLALITDTYSRKIVGYDISDSLELEGCKRALKMALKNLPAKHQLIHHSDRGSQYCSKEYTSLLKDRNINISMAARGNCYENALAERVNGILKNEFYLDQNFYTKSQAILSCTQAIKLYNEVRLHFGIGLSTPANKHAA